jgi:hypothetical protein
MDLSNEHRGAAVDGGRGADGGVPHQRAAGSYSIYSIVSGDADSLEMLGAIKH